MEELAKLLPQYITVPFLVGLLIIKLLVFMQASNFEKVLENRKQRTLRNLLFEFKMFIFVNLIVFLFSLIPRLIMSTVFQFSVVIIFVICFILIEFPILKIQKNCKLIRFIRKNYKKIRYIYGIDLVLYYCIGLHIITLSCQTAFKFHSNHIGGTLMEAVTTDESKAFVVITFILLMYTFFRLGFSSLVKTIVKYSTKKYKCTVTLSNGEIKNNIYLVQCINDWYVFSNYSNSEGDDYNYLISKDKIEYIHIIPDKDIL